MAKNKYFPKTTTAPLGVDQSEESSAADVAQDAPQDPVEGAKEPSETSEASVAPDTALSSEIVSEGLIEAVLSATPAVTETAPDAVVTPAPIDTPNEKHDMNIQHQLEVYAENMAIGKPVAPKDGGMHQYTLYKLIKTILDTEDQAEFTTKFNTVLAFARDQASKVFSESYVYRFPDQWPGSESEFANFRRILMVIILTADAQKRAANLATINMEKAMEGFTEKQKNRIIVFYGM